MPLFNPPGGGAPVDVPDEQVESRVAQGFTPISFDARGQQITQAAADARANERGVLGTINAGLTSLASGATAGLSDAALASVLSGNELERLRGERAAHPIVSTVSNLVGAVAPALLTGGASAPESAVALADALPVSQIAAAGAKISALGEGGGALAKLGAGALGGAAEGALYGVGGGVSDLALSEDPLTFERAASVLSSHALFGAGVGAAAGTLAKGAEIGLGKARAAIAEHAAAREAAESVPADLAGLDRKGLTAARTDELASIETSRVAERAQIADEIAAHRTAAYTEERIWQATEGVKADGVGPLAARAAKADKALRNILDNPIALAEKPEMARAALQRQQSALEGILSKQEAILAAPAKGDTPEAIAKALETRSAAMDAIPGALERNKALQERLASVTAEPTSPRLEAINAAKESFADRAALASQPKSMGEQIAGGLIFGKAHAAAGALGTAIGGPIGGLIGLAAPFLGQKASKIITDRVFGRVAGASAEAGARVSKAVDAFMTIGQPVARAAPVLATKVLSAVRYAPESAAPPANENKASTLATAYKARADEIRSQVTTGPTGAPVMRHEARQAVASLLTPIAAASPVAADRIETIAARRVEFLASKLPVRPDVGGMQFGPDRWQPSDMEMRTFARYAAAVEDPHAIVERLVDGSITPEDAEAMKTVYPEMHADITNQIVAKLPELRQQLPYQRRLALSMFSGVPVDPAMDPRILSSLQGNFTNEPGSEGGTQAPTPQPQFGSVKAEKPTPSQARSAGGEL